VRILLAQEAASGQGVTAHEFLPESIPA